MTNEEQPEIDPQLALSDPSDTDEDEDEEGADEEDEMPPPAHHLAMHATHTKWQLRQQSLIPLLHADLARLKAKLQVAPPTQHEKITELIARLQQALMEATKGNHEWPADGEPKEEPEAESDQKVGTEWESEKPSA